MDGRTEWTDGRRQNYIPLTSSGDNKTVREQIYRGSYYACTCIYVCAHILLNIALFTQSNVGTSQ